MFPSHKKSHHLPTSIQTVQSSITQPTQSSSFLRTNIPTQAQTVKNLPAMQETLVRSLVWEDPPGEGNGYPLQYCCLENSMDRGGAWWAVIQA